MMNDVVAMKRKPSEAVEIPGFGVGVRVQLKSGGQEMIVRESKRSGDKFMVVCDWQLGDGSPITTEYWPEQLWRIERFEVV
jgi:uncharacterized protein YodC (DUF2158 family)